MWFLLLLDIDPHLDRQHDYHDCIGSARSWNVEVNGREEAGKGRKGGREGGREGEREREIERERERQR